MGSGLQSSAPATNCSGVLPPTPPTSPDICPLGVSVTHSSCALAPSGLGSWGSLRFKHRSSTSPAHPACRSKPFHFPVRGPILGKGPRVPSQSTSHCTVTPLLLPDGQDQACQVATMSLVLRAGPDTDTHSVSLCSITLISGQCSGDAETLAKPPPCPSASQGHRAPGNSCPVCVAPCSLGDMTPNGLCESAWNCRNEQPEMSAPVFPFSGHRAGGWMTPASHSCH